MGIGKKGKRKGRGRPIGSYKGRYQLDSFQEEIRQKLEEGQTMNAIAGSLNVHFYTVQIYVKRHPELIPENYQKRSLRGHGKLYAKEEIIKEKIKEGMSKKAISRYLKVSRSALFNKLQQMKQER